MNGTFEIFTNKEWMILPSFVHGILPTVMNNANNHSLLGIDREKKNPMCINQAGDDIFREYEVTDDGQVLPVYDGWNGIDYLKDLKQPFVNVIPIDGPITRNGGACSYGSKDIRDWMMKASDNPYCQGHVLVVNTPGGSAWAKNDFQQGIDYAHSKGLRVIDFIDGMSASAGMYLASLCDEVYVMNLKDELGCVGVMASFFTMKSGDKNQFTNETYREYYATKSVNKNKEIRDIAQDDDATLLIEELDVLEAEFRADMKKAFPNATDEYLDGKMYSADKVMGIFCDGQMMLGDAVERIFALAEGTATPIERTASRKIAKRGKAPTRQQGAKATASITSPSAAAQAASGTGIVAQFATEPGNILSTQSNNINMKEKFPALFAALQVEEMQMQDGGAFMNEGLLANLNAAIEAKEQEAKDAKALADQLTAEKADMQSQLDAKTAEIETLKADHQKAIDTLNAEHQEALAEKDAALESAAKAHGDIVAAKDAEIQTLTEQAGKQDEALKAKDAEIETLTTDLNGAKASLQTAEQTISERDQQISDLTAQVDELKQEPGAEPQAGAQKTNGGGAEPAGVAVSTPVAERTMTYAEMREVWDGQK